jgi:hypothetical protein
VYEEFKQKGVKIVSELEFKPWKIKEFTVEEINGYWLRIGEGIE